MAFVWPPAWDGRGKQGEVAGRRKTKVRQRRMERGTTGGGVKGEREGGTEGVYSGMSGRKDI